MLVQRIVVVLLTATLLAAVSAAAAAAADPRVAGLQVALRARGLYRGPIDGIAGAGTSRALARFQQRAHLAVDGVLGPRTRRALGPLGRPRLGARPLARGAVGGDVAELQFLLARSGVSPGRIDGRFGAGTERALRHYQRGGGLAIDGVAGPTTLARLLHASAPQAHAHVRLLYAVRSGDTLSALAARFHTTPAVLARENHLDPHGVLFAGAPLRVSGLASAAPALPVPATIDYWAGRYGVDSRLARALAWMESGYQTNLTSPVGAWGVMQVLPGTWEFVEISVLGRRVPRTPEGDIRVGTAYLHRLLGEFNGDERLALAAWYQGDRAVREHGVYRETRRFVENVLALKRRV